MAVWGGLPAPGLALAGGLGFSVGLGGGVVWAREAAEES